MSHPAEPIRAAGGVVWRNGPEGTEVLLVHRPRYDDWTFPKGKADEGEDDEATARREVEEETGIRAVLGPELARTRYTDNRGRPKVVRYWSMPVDRRATPDRAPDDEVDGLAWLSFDDAAARLSYDRDRPVLDALRAALASGHCPNAPAVGN